MGGKDKEKSQLGKDYPNFLGLNALSHGFPDRVISLRVIPEAWVSFSKEEAEFSNVKIWNNTINYILLKIKFLHI
jgi:hypothetical protein